MATQSRAELFAMAKKKRQEEKQRQSERGNWTSSEASSIAYVALQTDGERVVRLLGLPVSDRMLPTDAKQIEMASILGDDGKRFRCIFPDHRENKSYILWRIYDLVLAGTYSDGADGRRVKTYTYQNIHPECFRRVMYNDNPENKYEKGWKTTTSILINCIDRSDPEWHKEHKHTKLLSKRASEVGDSGKFYYEAGIPTACYNAIFDDVVEWAGDWEEYDVVLKKMSSSPWYKALQATQEYMKLSEPSKAIVVDGPLTAEERAYEMYNLDELFPVTSYRRIKEKLGEFIKKVDVDFKKNFSQELDELVAEEQRRWKEEGKNEWGFKVEKKQVTNSASDIESYRKEEHLVEDDELVPSAPATAQTQAPKAEDKAPWESAEEEDVPVRTRTAVAPAPSAEIDWDALADGTYNGKVYKGVPYMTQEEKDYVLGVNEDGSFLYKKVQGVHILRNESSDFRAPEFFHVDPLSGDMFE